MHEAFQVHILTDGGKTLATKIAESFDKLLGDLEFYCPKDSREMALVRTKLEEACFFAKKAMAKQNSQ